MTVRILLLLLLCILASCQQYDAKENSVKPKRIVFSTSWENGIDARIQREAIDAEAIKIVSLNNSLIPKALEVTIRRDDDYEKIDNGTPRAELSFARIIRFARGGDYVIDWQTCIPLNYEVDRKQPEVISQIHQGIASGYPTFALFISENGRYGVRIRTGGGRTSEGKQFDYVESDKGRVVNWRLHYIPDDTGRNAILELRKDNKEVFNLSGVPNAYMLDDNAYFKIGIYKSGWKTKPTDVEFRRLYYGTFSISRLN